MKQARRLFFVMMSVILMTAIIAGCGKDSCTNSKEDLIGAWELIEFNINVSGVKINAISVVGLDITLIVRDDNTYTLTTIQIKEEITTIENGTWTIDCKTITINPDNDDPKTLEYSIDGNTATLKTTLPNVVDQSDENLMSNIPATSINEDGTLKDTPVTMIYSKVI